MVNKTNSAKIKTDIVKIKEKLDFENSSKEIADLSGGSYTADYSNIIPDSYKDTLEITSSGNLIYIGEPGTELEEILEESKVYDVFLTNIESLYNFAKDYKNDNSSITATETELCLQYIRRDVYNNSAWDMAAGTIDTNFLTYVDEKNSSFREYFKTAKIPKDEDVDFVHMCAALNSNVYTSSSLPPEYSGWAGDLVTLMGQVVIYDTSGSLTEDVLVTYAKSLLGTNESTSSFGKEDILADMDALIIYNFETDNLFNAFYNYYYRNNNSINNRKSVFAELVGGKSNIKAMVNNKFSSQTTYVTTLLSAYFMQKTNNASQALSLMSRYNNNSTKYINCVATAFHDYFNN